MFPIISNNLSPPTGGFIGTYVHLYFTFTFYPAYKPLKNRLHERRQIVLSIGVEYTQTLAPEAVTEDGPGGPDSRANVWDILKIIIFFLFYTDLNISSHQLFYRRLNWWLSYQISKL